MGGGGFGMAGAVTAGGVTAGVDGFLLKKTNATTAISRNRMPLMMKSSIGGNFCFSAGAVAPGVEEGLAAAGAAGLGAAGGAPRIICV